MHSPTRDVSGKPALVVRGLTAHQGQRPVLSEIDLSVGEGELWAVLGPNGAGKSTLLRTCLGLHPRRAGQVELLGQALETWDRKALARSVAWVPQQFEGVEGFTGLELALMGRNPHLGSWGLPSRSDEARARQVLEEVGALSLADRNAEALSGGERRLLLVARALVQEPRLLLLDEPTAFLDLRHQVEVLQRLKARARQGLSVVAVLHDVNLAAMVADRVLLLRDGRVLAQGPAEEVLRTETLEALYGLPLTRAVAASGQPLFAPRQGP